MQRGLQYLICLSIDYRACITELETCTLCVWRVPDIILSDDNLVGEAELCSSSVCQCESVRDNSDPSASSQHFNAHNLSLTSR